MKLRILVVLLAFGACGSSYADLKASGKLREAQQGQQGVGVPVKADPGRSGSAFERGTWKNDSPIGREGSVEGRPVWPVPPGQEKAGDISQGQEKVKPLPPGQAKKVGGVEPPAETPVLGGVVGGVVSGSVPSSGVSVGIYGVEPYFINSGVDVTAVISGVSFGQGLIVRFNGVEVPVLRASDTALAVSIPAGLGIQGSAVLEIIDPVTGVARAMDSAVHFVVGTTSSGVAGGYVHRDLGFINRQGLIRAFDVYEPVGYGARLVGSKSVVVLHDGTFASGSKSEASSIAVASSLVKAGFVVFVPSYGLAPEHVYPQGYNDVQDLVKMLKTGAYSYRLDPDRVGVVGVGAGGQLSALAGVEKLRSGSVVTGCSVSINGLYDLRTSVSSVMDGLVASYIPSRDRARLTDASAIHYLREAPVARFLLVHGAGNAVVPVGQAEAFVAKAKASKIKADLIVLPAEGAELSENGRVRALTETTQFLSNCLGG